MTTLAWNQLVDDEAFGCPLQDLRRGVVSKRRLPLESHGKSHIIDSINVKALNMMHRAWALKSTYMIKLLILGVPLK